MRRGTRWWLRSTRFACALLGALALAAAVAEPAGNVPDAAPAGPAPCTLYVFNISGPTLIPSNQAVAERDQVLVSLPRLTWARLSIAPGAHDLYAHPFKGRHVAFDAPGGGTLYLVIGYRPEKSWAFPLAGDPLAIRLISEADAQPLLQQLKPVDTTK
jgi:hypothetical protein